MNVLCNLYLKIQTQVLLEIGPEGSMRVHVSVPSGQTGNFWIKKKTVGEFSEDWQEKLLEDHKRE